MPVAILDHAVDFAAGIAARTRQPKVRVAFHGGEPLLASFDYFRHALRSLVDRFGGLLELSIQSNLWRLDDATCSLLLGHRVRIGTSLDGPEDITDSQRGAGYFSRTMAGIRRARAHGLEVGCIATLTTGTVRRWREVFDFFLDEGINFSVHAASPAPHDAASPLTLPAADYGDLIKRMLDYYIIHRKDITVASLDDLVRGVARGRCRACTFRPCFGLFLAIDPSGDVFPCQRFCGRHEWSLGNVENRPSLDELCCSPVARRFHDRQAHMRTTCSACRHYDYCQGGCAHAAWSAGGEVQVDRVRDPYCEAYRIIFDTIADRLAEEMAAPENISAFELPLLSRSHPLLRRGQLIELARGSPHPAEVAHFAKWVVAEAELNRGPDVESVAARLLTFGVCKTKSAAEASLLRLVTTPETSRKAQQLLGAARRYLGLPDEGPINTPKYDPLEWSASSEETRLVVEALVLSASR